MYNKVLDVSDINELSSLADYLVGKLPSSQTKMGAEEAISTESSQTDQDKYVKEFMNESSHGPEEFQKDMYGKDIDSDKMISAVNSQ